MQPAINTDLVSVSPTAAQAITELMSEKNLEGHALRLYVAGKSCSGYQYGISLDDSISETDTTTDVSGIIIVIDKDSFEYVKGATLDFIDDERGKGFLIQNPSMAQSCDCSGGAEESNGCSGCG